MTPPAVLLGGGVIAVPVARSLGRSGVRVVALGHETDPVRRSRHCARFVDTGAGQGVQERWLEWLERREEPGAVILPCYDEGVELVARHRAQLEAWGYRPIEANDEIALAMLDKLRTYELAAEVGVRAPRTALLTDDTDFEAATAGLPFPVALKPRVAHQWARHFGIRQKVLLAASAEELAAAYDRVRGLGIDVLVTEVIPGGDDAYHSFYSFLDEAGRPLARLTKQKLRQHPPGFGLATYHRIHRDPQVIETGLRFFQGIGLRGMACVEFKRDPRNGELVLIETNHRFTGGHEIVRHAGIDFALIAYNRLAGRPLPPTDDYRVGVRMWHPVEDVRSVLASRRASGEPLRPWLRRLAHRQHFPLWDARDPGPSLDSWAGMVRNLLDRQRRAESRAAATARATSSGPAAPSVERPALKS